MQEPVEAAPSREARVQDEASTAAAAAVLVAQLLGDIADEDLVLPSGITLRFKPVPPYAMRQVHLSIPEPTPPTFTAPGDTRPQPNPMHPAYLQAQADRTEAVYLAGVKTCLIMGTDVVSVPDGMYRPEDQGWVDELEAAGLTVDVRNEARRKLSWIELYALRTPADIARVSAAAIARAGLTEGEVAATLASFLRHEGRRADREIGSGDERADGDRVLADDSGARPGA